MACVPHLARQAIFNDTQKLHVLHINFLWFTQRHIDLDLYKDTCVLDTLYF